MGSIRRAIGVLVAAAAVTLAAAAPANAGLLVASAKNCQPRSRLRRCSSAGWIPCATRRPPVAAPSRRQGWTLSGGARIVPGNEPWKVGGSGDSKSLQLPRGSRATTGVMCVGIGHPVMRFFARRTSGWLLDSLKVDVLFEGAGGQVGSLPVGLVLGGGSWQPTLPFPVLASLLPLLPGEKTPVQFRFTPVGGGTWQIDDVFVDPWRCTVAPCVGGGVALRRGPAAQRVRSLRVRVRSSCFSTTFWISFRISGGPLALTVPGLERLAPVAHLAVLGQLVEVRARHREADLRVGGDVARDLRTGHLDAEQLDVAAPAQLELDHQLELLERGHLLLELQDGRFDQGLGLSGRHRCGILSAAMDYEHLRYEQDGPVTVITIDRPERMNAIGPVLARELLDAWTRFRDDDAALVGRADRRRRRRVLRRRRPQGRVRGRASSCRCRAEERAAHARGERPGILGPTRWTDLHKPTIAAVNGVAYAGGLEWACWTDLCIADEHATFGVTCRRWNIGLGDGGTQRLPRIVGFRVAMELIVTGRVIDAHEAQRIGLVNEVVPRGTCRERARELAHAIAALPQPAIHTDKEAAVRGFGRPLEEGLRIEAECFDRLIDGARDGRGPAPLQRARPPRPRRRRAGDAGAGAAAPRRLTSAISPPARPAGRPSRTSAVRHELEPPCGSSAARRRPCSSGNSGSPGAHATSAGLSKLGSRAAASSV